MLHALSSRREHSAPIQALQNEFVLKIHSAADQESGVALYTLICCKVDVPKSSHIKQHKTEIVVQENFAAEK